MIFLLGLGCVMGSLFVAWLGFIMYASSVERYRKLPKPEAKLKISEKQNETMAKLIKVLVDEKVDKYLGENP